MTDTVFTKDETKLMQKGFKYNLPEEASAKTFKDLKVVLEIALNNNPIIIAQKYAAARLIKDAFMKHAPNTYEHSVVKSLKSKEKMKEIELSL